MAKSHICTSCGHELARTPARVEPHYRLPIVLCPGCATVCIRRRHPIQAAWRRARSLARGLVSVLLTLAGAALAIIATLGVADSFRTDLTNYGITPRTLIPMAIEGGSDPDSNWGRFLGAGGGVMLVAVACWSAACGAWSAAVLPHHRRLIVWPAWAFLVLTAPVLLNLLFPRSLTSQTGMTVRSLWFQLIRDWPLGELLMVVGLSPLGFPLGRLVRRMLDRRRVRAWTRRLARARKQRKAS